MGQYYELKEAWLISYEWKYYCGTSQERQSTVLQLHHDALQHIVHHLNIQKVQNDGLKPQLAITILLFANARILDKYIGDWH